MDFTDILAVISPAESISGSVAVGARYIVTDKHDELTHRDSADQHPISAITGLQSALGAKGTYSKPVSGIPGSDLTAAVQTSLTRADTLTDSYINSLIDTKLGVIEDGNY